jgi:hypothetical protein
MLTVNVSDFVVQEIIEQLWACYVMKYGEDDARRAEKSFYDFRKLPSQISTMSSTRLSRLDVVDEQSGATDAKRKYMRQRSGAGIGLLSSTSAYEASLSPTREQNIQV